MQGLGIWDAGSARTASIKFVCANAYEITAGLSQSLSSLGRSANESACRERDHLRSPHLFVHSSFAFLPSIHPSIHTSIHLYLFLPSTPPHNHLLLGQSSGTSDKGSIFATKTKVVALACPSRQTQNALYPSHVPSDTTTAGLVLTFPPFDTSPLHLPPPFLLHLICARLLVLCADRRRPVGDRTTCTYYHRLD